MHERNLTGLGSVGFCVCVKCGTTTPHRGGVPCTRQRCPHCGKVMFRTGWPAPSRSAQASKVPENTVNGESVLHALKKAHPQLEVVVLTGHGSVDSAVRCMRLGCFTYLEKSCGLEVLLETLEQALRSHTERMRKPEKAKVNAIASVAVHGSAEEILR